MHCSLWSMSIDSFPVCFSLSVMYLWSAQYNFWLHSCMMVTSRCFWFRVFVLGKYKSTVSLACEVCCLTFFYFLQFPSCTLFIYLFVYSFSEILAPGGLILSNLTETQSVHAKSVIKLKLFNSLNLSGGKHPVKSCFGEILTPIHRIW